MAENTPTTLQSALPAAAARAPGLDTLRALAIVLVLMSHGRTILKWDWLQAPGAYGWSGVDLFFVLSGFLIGSQLVSAVARDGQVDFRRFYLKRALRILPSYLVCLALYALWPAFNEAKGIDPLWRFLTFTMNFGRRADGFSHAWSLCVEEHFYLLFPAAVALWLKAPRLLRPVPWLVMMTAAGMAIRYALVADGTDFFMWVYRPTYCRLDGLMVGLGLALLRICRPTVWEGMVGRPWRILGLGLCFLAVGLWMLDGDKTPVAAACGFPLVALGYGGFVAAALAPASVKFWLAQWRVPGAAPLATASYALYLTHKQMFRLATKLIDAPREHAFLTGLAAIGLAAAMTLALHWLVERPVLRLRERLLPPG